MPKVTRAPARKAGGRSEPLSRPGAPARRSRSRAPAPPSFFTHLRNRASARVRAAHYRAGAAARLISLLAIVLMVGAVVILSGLGRLNSSLAYAGESTTDALTRAGFRLEAIDVAGAETAPFDDIRAALGLEYGQSIFALDLETARQRVEALDWVGDAQVFRLLPNRIQVVVTEQIPMARWQIDGEILVIDVKGAPIEKAGASDYAGLPLVVGEGAAERAPQLLAALKQFPTVSRHVEAAQRVGQRRWTLFLESGAELYLPEQDGEAALAIVSQLEAQRGLLSAPAESIDLRNPDKIVVRPLPDDESDGAAGPLPGVGPEREA